MQPIQSILEINNVINELELKQSMQVADFGCGKHGYFVLPISKRLGKKGKVYAVDVIQDALAMIKKKATLDYLNNIQIVWADIEVPDSINIPANSLDLVLVVNVLFQLQKPENVFDQAHKLLKKSGKLLVIDWNDQYNEIGPPDDLKINSNQVMKIAEKKNFKFLKEVSTGRFHFGLLFEKV